jgi:hypothetical protein
MMSTPRQEETNLGRAWIVLTVVLAAHVADEALTDFLSVYNPLVLAARERLGWFPMPTFTFGIWLTGLILGVGLLTLLTPFAYRRVAAVRVAAFPYAVLMLFNGMAHLAASVYFRRWMPGATTAPFLIGASIWLFLAARTRN